jgi:hypothetical protein
MTRPRGFIDDWRPQQKTRVLLDHVDAIIEEYRDYLPLTCRQVFYRLVGRDLIDKTEKVYGNLTEILNRARRAQRISMDVIRDDGFTGGMATRIGYTGPGEFAREMAWQARSYRRDRQAGQARRLVLWCEASGMVPQIRSVASDYGVTVKSSGGFDSVTTKHAISRPLDNAVVLHIGDYDPSGECMFDALAEDITAFGSHYGNDIEFYRLAVTPAQIRAYNLPTAPPKASSHQARKAMTETTQAEAIDPASLAAIIREAIESRLDMDVYRQVVNVECDERQAIIAQWEVAA